MDLIVVGFFTIIGIPIGILATPFVLPIELYKSFKAKKDLKDYSIKENMRSTLYKLNI